MWKYIQDYLSDVKIAVNRRIYGISKLYQHIAGSDILRLSTPCQKL